MSDQSYQLSIPLQIGFGLCAERNPQPDSDGAIVFEYRYVPSGLWMIDPAKTIAQINRAANVYPTFNDYPPDLIAEEPPGGQADLTAAGEEFYRSCPRYGRLHALKPTLTWTAYRPDGETCLEVRSGLFSSMMGHAITCTPIELWAKICFDPWGHLFEPHPTAGFWPMKMQEPAALGTREWMTHGLAEKPENVATAEVSERVDFPYGLFKSVYASVSPDQLEVCQRYPVTPEMELMKCALAQRRSADGPFEWSDHWVFRFTVPAPYVGRMLHWMNKNEFAHPADWALKAALPVFGQEVVEVKFNPSPEDGRYETLFIVLKPLAELDMATRLQYELDVSNLPKPPLD
jgi:hypothetical protein